MKFDLFYELMMPAEWDEALERQVFAECFEQLEYADRLGFHTVWMARHHAAAGFSHASSTETFFGALAMRTKNLRLGFGVEILPFVHPIHVAERVANLDLISDGRVEFGTNGSTIDKGQCAYIGVDPATTNERWMESIHILPELWTKRGVTHQGKYWSWENPATVVPRCVQQPHPPIWTAASRRESVINVGKRGLGLLAGSYRSSSTPLEEDIAAYREAASNPTDQIGYRPTNQVSLLQIIVCHDKDDAGAAARAKQAAATFIGFVRFGYANVQGIGEDLARASDDDILEQLGVVGAPEQVVEKLQRAKRMGVDRVMLLTQMAGLTHKDIMRSHELMAEQVFPHFQ